LYALSLNIYITICVFKNDIKESMMRRKGRGPHFCSIKRTYVYLPKMYCY